MKRCYSLKRNKEFRRVYHYGKSLKSRSLVLVYTKSAHEFTRFGFSVSKKLGNSVVRNRVRRRLREAVRLQQQDIAGSYNIVFIARAPILTESFDALRAQVHSLLHRAGAAGPKAGNQ
ncbi:MAG: ribonuclease P protein component [Clostridia bacterium]|nr:ribonuclease P protein component [Clostridia bacterium]